MKKQLLAPNGKPSNLTPEQYKLVRTKAFKEWFGDWEILAKAEILSNDIKGVYKNVALNNIERFLFEISQQANSSDSEYKGAIETVGKSIVNLALKLFPDSKVEDEYIPVVSKVVDDNREPLVVYHGTYADFTVFEGKYDNRGNKLIYFSSKKNVSKLYGENIKPFFLKINYLKSIYADSKSFNQVYDETMLSTIIKEVDISWYYDFEGLMIEDVYDSPDGKKKGEKGNTYAVKWAEQIKLADGTNTTFDVNNDDIRFKNGGRTIAQTPAPKKERIYGSNINKEKSSESNTSAKQIVFDEKTLKSIKNKIHKHNEENPDKKITLSSAKAVVRRGMGAYSKSHRPTIKGGKPNSRVAWGLARLNAFIYKIKNGVSKSGKYIQDDDLINELNIKYNIGGEISKQSINNVKNDKINYLNVLNSVWSFFGIKLD